MVGILVAIAVGFYIVQVVTVVVIILVDILCAKDRQDYIYSHYTTKRQLIIDLIPGSWILKLVGYVKEWYKTLK